MNETHMTVCFSERRQHGRRKSAVAKKHGGKYVCKRNGFNWIEAPTSEIGAKILQELGYAPRWSR
jgi:hypothetical protein